MSIDLNFRPAHYADFDDPVAVALNGIKGQMRREMVRDMLTAEGEKRDVYDVVLGPIDEEVLGERASEAFMSTMNQAYGPSWMGGEYLPDLDGREVEIARVVLASVLMDVFSVRARLVDGAYHYSMVDEYSTEFFLTQGASEQPLTLAELVGLLDTAVGQDLQEGGHRFVEGWWWQQWEYGYPPEECTAFAWVESEQYPELGAYYQERARQWRIEREREWAEAERVRETYRDLNRRGDDARPGDPPGPKTGAAP
jgi:hypothetical protein